VGICNQEIDLGPLNGTLYIFYYPLTAKDTLAKFINFSNDKVDDHKLKATAINDQKILRSKDNVYGTFFELQGDVATNYQFYLTDSTNHFLRAELLLNSRPNYDSLKPHLDYIQVDLLKMAKSLKWK
jgi:gliding motility-associated lipoprotein GldD